MTTSLAEADRPPSAIRFPRWTLRDPRSARGPSRCGASSSAATRRPVMPAPEPATCEEPPRAMACRMPQAPGGSSTSRPPHPGRVVRHGRQRPEQGGAEWRCVNPRWRRWRRARAHLSFRRATLYRSNVRQTSSVMSLSAAMGGPCHMTQARDQATGSSRSAAPSPSCAIARPHRPSGAVATQNYKNTGAASTILGDRQRRCPRLLHVTPSISAHRIYAENAVSPGPRPCCTTSWPIIARWRVRRRRWEAGDNKQCLDIEVRQDAGTSTGSLDGVNFGGLAYNGNTSMNSNIFSKSGTRTVSGCGFPTLTHGFQRRNHSKGRWIRCGVLVQAGCRGMRWAPSISGTCHRVDRRGWRGHPSVPGRRCRAIFASTTSTAAMARRCRPGRT